MLGGQAFFGAGITFLANSSDSRLALMLSVLAIISCLVVLFTFLLTRILTKVL